MPISTLKPPPTKPIIIKIANFSKSDNDKLDLTFDQFNCSPPLSIMIINNSDYGEGDIKATLNNQVQTIPPRELHMFLSDTMPCYLSIENDNNNHSGLDVTIKTGDQIIPS